MNNDPTSQDVTGRGLHTHPRHQRKQRRSPLSKYWNLLCVDTRKRDYIIRTDDSGWRTNKEGESLTVDLLENCIDRPKDPENPERLGVRPGVFTRWLAVDIDTGSQYHPSNDPDGPMLVIAALAAIGLCGYVPLQSSDSGGLHLWFPVPLQRSEALALRAHRALLDADLTIALGTLEVFPNRRRSDRPAYQGIRLPLMHPASHVLRLSDLNPAHPEKESFSQKLGHFLGEWELALKRNADRWPEVERSTERDPYASISESYARLKLGFTGHGQTQQVMYHAMRVAAYEGCDGATRRSRANALAAQAPGFRDWSRHQKLISRGQSVAYLWKRLPDGSKVHYFPSNRDGDNRFRQGGRPPRHHHHQDSMPAATAAPAPTTVKGGKNTLTRACNRAAIIEAVEAVLSSWRKSYPTIGAATAEVVKRAHALGHEQINARTCRYHQDLILHLVPSRQPRAAA